jgi:hypothetical protein
MSIGIWSACDSSRMQFTHTLSTLLYACTNSTLRQQEWHIFSSILKFATSNYSRFLTCSHLACKSTIWFLDKNRNVPRKDHSNVFKYDLSNCDLSTVCLYASVSPSSAPQNIAKGYVRKLYLVVLLSVCVSVLSHRRLTDGNKKTICYRLLWPVNIFTGGGFLEYDKLF